ncbi:hypothetical protein M422DRAFT_34880 [Sphaerobolus stellatus SS14]|uniref:Uncharacterized protein n=1 Tax=Sphaerobolus stellatus (strain SS14) TaxID=990650 RepID=A0A0C9V055_SPHS4|nr:hypothetical protein M422DRAFT_34880 [Sphaerobolus stellatus SS14]
MSFAFPVSRLVFFLFISFHWAFWVPSPLTWGFRLISSISLSLSIAPIPSFRQYITVKKSKNQRRIKEELSFFLLTTPATLFLFIFILRLYISFSFLFHFPFIPSHPLRISSPLPIPSALLLSTTDNGSTFSLVPIAFLASLSSILSYLHHHHRAPTLLITSLSFSSRTPNATDYPYDHNPRPAHPRSSPSPSHPFNSIGAPTFLPFAPTHSSASYDMDRDKQANLVFLSSLLTWMQLESLGHYNVPPPM